MRHTFPPGLGYDVGIRMVAPEQLQSIVEALLVRGYSDEHVRAILGGNWMRVAQAVWVSGMPRCDGPAFNCGDSTVR